MNIKGKMMQAYFNYAYNAVYDLTTGRLNRYHWLQKRCVDKLGLHDNDRILCVGVGTGNESGNFGAIHEGQSHFRLCPWTNQLQHCQVPEKPQGSIIIVITAIPSPSMVIIIVIIIVVHASRNTYVGRINEPTVWPAIFFKCRIHGMEFYGI